MTSALHQHTDLPINIDNIEISGEIMDPARVMIKATYHHRDEDARVTLPDRTVINLRPATPSGSTSPASTPPRLCTVTPGRLSGGDGTGANDHLGGTGQRLRVPLRAPADVLAKGR